MPNQKRLGAGEKHCRKTAEAKKGKEVFRLTVAEGLLGCLWFSVLSVFDFHSHRLGAQLACIGLQAVRAALAWWPPWLINSTTSVLRISHKCPLRFTLTGNIRERGFQEKQLSPAKATHYRATTPTSNQSLNPNLPIPFPSPTSAATRAYLSCS